MHHLFLSENLLRLSCIKWLHKINLSSVIPKERKTAPCIFTQTLKKFCTIFWHSIKTNPKPWKKSNKIQNKTIFLKLFTNQTLITWFNKSINGNSLLVECSTNLTAMFSFQPLCPRPHLLGVSCLKYGDQNKSTSYTRQHSRLHYLIVFRDQK